MEMVTEIIQEPDSFIIGRLDSNNFLQYVYLMTVFIDN